MCEPTHSIIQYNDPNDPPDDDVGGSGSAQSGGYSIGRLTGGLGKWTKKIRNWLHLSMMGRGHSETIGERNGMVNRYYDHVFTLYEASWWNRRVSPDGGRRGSGIQLDCASDYAKLVSIGDTTQLRRFLETSMTNTDNPELYVQAVRGRLLTAKGKQEFDSRFSKVFKENVSMRSMSPRFIGDNLQSVIKFTLGFTRKRSLLVPEWADDGKIWTPAPEKLVLS